MQWMYLIPNSACNLQKMNKSTIHQLLIQLSSDNAVGKTESSFKLIISFSKVIFKRMGCVPRDMSNIIK